MFVKMPKNLGIIPRLSAEKREEKKNSELGWG
jgi:hypothetical protein